MPLETQSFITIQATLENQSFSTIARNEKRKKLLGFSFHINIGNFEAFIWNLNLSTNCLFWRCEFSNDWIILLVGKTSERCQRRAEINFYWQVSNARILTTFHRLSDKQKNPANRQIWLKNDRGRSKHSGRKPSTPSIVG